MIRKFLFNATIVCALAYVGAAGPEPAGAQTTLRPPVVAPACTATGVQLSWSQSPGASGYQVLVSVNGGNYNVVANLSRYVTSFNVTGLQPGSTVRMKVRAVSAFGGFSDSAVITYVVPAPESVVTAKGNTEYALIHGVNLAPFRQAPNGTTYCNYALVALSTAIGTPVPQRLATDQIDWLANPANGWTAVASGRQAQALANQGYAVVATYRNPGNSHVALVTPWAWNGGFVDSVGPKVSQAGILTGFDYNASLTFGQWFPQVRYYSRSR